MYLSFKPFPLNCFSRFQFVQNCTHIFVAALRMFNDFNDFVWLSLRKVIQVDGENEVLEKFFTNWSDLSQISYGFG